MRQCISSRLIGTRLMTGHNCTAERVLELQSQNKKFKRALDELASKPDMDFRSEQFHEILNTLINYGFFRIKNDPGQLQDVHAEYMTSIVQFSIDTFDHRDIKTDLLEFITHWWKEHIQIEP
jgi:hypothetical protein